MSEKDTKTAFDPAPLIALEHQTARCTALNAAVQVCGKTEDYHLVIRAARDFLTFLKEG
jgi:hypothetical protein